MNMEFLTGFPSTQFPLFLGERHHGGSNSYRIKVQLQAAVGTEPIFGIGGPMAVGYAL